MKKQEETKEVKEVNFFDNNILWSLPVKDVVGKDIYYTKDCNVCYSRCVSIYIGTEPSCDCCDDIYIFKSARLLLENKRKLDVGDCFYSKKDVVDYLKEKVNKL